MEEQKLWYQLITCNWSLLTDTKSRTASHQDNALLKIVSFLAGISTKTQVSGSPSMHKPVTSLRCDHLIFAVITWSSKASYFNIYMTTILLCITQWSLVLDLLVLLIHVQSDEYRKAGMGLRSGSLCLTPLSAREAVRSRSFDQGVRSLHRLSSPKATG